MRKKGLVGVLLTALALCVALVGCADNTAQVAEEAANNFVGTWAIDSLKRDGEEAGEQDIAMAQAMGVYVTLEEEGAATVEMFGIKVAGTWTAKDATTATLTISEEDVGQAETADLPASLELSYADDKLSMSAEDETMVFKRIDPSEKGSTDLGTLLGELGDASAIVAEGDLSDDVSSALEDVSELDVTVADDQYCTIRVIGRGDYYGDPGYLVSVTNKTDAQIDVDDSEAFTVSGQPASPIFSMIVDPAQTKNEILWFDNSDLLEAGIEELADVHGQLTVRAYESGDVLGTYEFGV